MTGIEVWQAGMAWRAAYVPDGKTLVSLPWLTIAQNGLPIPRKVDQFRDEFVRFIDAMLKELPEKEVRKQALEIGFDTGGTHFCWKKLFDHVISVDCNPQCFLSYAATEDMTNSHLVCGMSHSPVTIRAVKRLLNGRGIDFLFIDGEHTYEAVLGDWLGYYDLVNVGGVVGFHDIVIPGIRRVLEEIASGQVTGKPMMIDFVCNLNPNGMGMAFVVKRQ